MRQILEALDEVECIHDRSTLILAHTIKGRGVSFMENSHAWYGAVPSTEQMAQVRKALLAGA